MIVVLIAVADTEPDTESGAWGWFAFNNENAFDNDFNNDFDDSGDDDCDDDDDDDFDDDDTIVSSRIQLVANKPRRMLELEAACDVLRTFPGPVHMHTWTTYLPTAIHDASTWRRQTVQRQKPTRTPAHHEATQQLLQLTDFRTVTWRTIDRDNPTMRNLFKTVAQALDDTHGPTTGH